jgi:hypothetical protein
MAGQFPSVGNQRTPSMLSLYDSLSQTLYHGGTLEIISKSQETPHKNYYKRRLWIQCK